MSGPYPHSSRQNYIYVIEEHGGSRPAVKIGIAVDPNLRLSGMQAGNYRHLNLVSFFPVRDRKLAIAVENSIHRRLREKRLRGEWFSIGSSEAMALVVSIISEMA